MSSLLEVKDLKKHYPISLKWGKSSTVKAVDGVSFHLKKGETLGLVGESGCGKSTTGMSVLRLTEPTSGEIYFEGENINKLKGREMRKYRKQMQIVFQDPYASLNPRWKIKDTIAEALQIHKIATGAKKLARVEELLERVGIDPSYQNRYPHEFSGGQRQRIGIARALAVKPKFIVCDEPVSALDVSVQAQVINLLQDLQKEYNLSYLFIAHDLGVVRHICNRVAVMYLGKIVELASTEELYNNPQHPYTRALLSAVPVPDPLAKRDEIILSGDIPSPLNPPQGCSFNPRCIYAKEKCQKQPPTLKEQSAKHLVSCHFADKLGGE